MRNNSSQKILEIMVLKCNLEFAQLLNTMRNPQGNLLELQSSYLE